MSIAPLTRHITDSLKMIICPRAGFGHGGIGKGYNNVVAISCPYTRRKRLAMRIGMGKVPCVHTERRTNGCCSFSWLANEVLWSVICDTDYVAPQAGDEEDENCDNQGCTA